MTNKHLYDYQIELVDKFLSNPKCVQEVAPGAGKTLIADDQVKRFEEQLKDERNGR